MALMISFFARRQNLVEDLAGAAEEQSRHISNQSQLRLKPTHSFQNQRFQFYSF